MKIADPDSLPPTSPKTMVVLILILVGLIIATAKAALYPAQPATWAPLHNPGATSLADTNTLLTKSGAVIESIKASPDLTTETWTLRHRTGIWTVLVRYSKTPQGDVVRSVQIHSEISHLPSFTRTWNYPPSDSSIPVASSAAAEPPAPAAEPAASAPTK